MKNFRLHTLKTWLPMVAVLALCIYSSEDPPVDDGTNSIPSESFSSASYSPGVDVACSGAPTPNIPPASTPGIETSSYDFVNGVPGVKITCTTYHQSGTAYGEPMIFNPVQTPIYPGHVFVGGSTTNGEYKPVKG